MSTLSSWIEYSFSSPWLIPFIPRREIQLSSHRLGSRESVSRFGNTKFINLETYRKNGEPIKTPVWFIQKAKKLFVRAGHNSGKVKRVRNNPKTIAVPPSFAGGLRGKSLYTTSSFADGEDFRSALNLVNRKYNMKRVRDVYNWMRGRK